MKFRNRRRWRIIRDYVVGWTLAFVFLSIVRGVGTTENGELQFDFQSSLMIALTMGPIIGSISGYAQVLTEERIYKRISIQKLLMLRLIYAFLFIILLILLAYAVYQLYFGTDIGLWAFAFGEGSFAIYFYVLTVDFFLAALSQVNLALGDNNLGKLLRGKFYTPREEERIFMFLDLQASTELAEKLGHISYSKMIQDCFNDLGVVVEDEAEIYQYVGDEVVLTWKMKDGLRNQNSLNAYFTFMQQLNKKKDYYIKNYDCIPFFKAGIHAGEVTVTEVGKYKKEIAYHGDTINTAARIQGKANEFNSELLISEHLKNQLSEVGYRFNQLGSIPLRGKAEDVVIFSVLKDD
jgi:adenylate cyclase